MKFHNIKMVGPFNNEQLASLPTFSASRDQSRMVWLNDGSLWYGTQTQWIQIMAGGSVHNDLGGRSDNDCHPISAITGLEDALQNAGMSWEVRSSNFTAVKHTGYFADTSSGPITVTLPVSASIGDPIYFVDSVGAFDETNKLIIDNNGHNIMGFQDTLEITEKYMSVYLVYADTAKGWVIADGKGCDEDISGGEISADKTVYLAPSASNQSPTGVAVGSDTTGDGSLISPFFSIKRAMEYLENFNIKVGTYVTIRGLPGMYNYNENHAVEVKHKDAKYIKVQFDMLETGNYHTTTVTTDPVTTVSNSDHDLITFTVNDMGSSFYQIQAGNYIGIVPDRTALADHLYAVWGGYYLVHSVDVLNKKITIVFKRQQEGGSYNAGHLYRLPETIPGGVNIQVVKYSTHVYTTISDTSTLYKESFFVSDFGFDSIQINASDTEYYTTHTDVQRYNLITIYDGVINDICFHVNGYLQSIYFNNLECNFLDNSTEFLYSCISTSCLYGLYIVKSNIESMTGYISNNSNYGVVMYNSTLPIVNLSDIFCATNIYHDGISVNGGNSLYKGSNIPTEDTTNIFYCSIGILLFDGVVRGCGLNVGYCDTGFNIYPTSELYFRLTYVPTNNAKIYNCNIGITGHGVLDLDYVDIYYNTVGVSFYNGFVYSESNDDSNIFGNTTYGIYLTKSNLIINNINIYSNGSQGIYITNNSKASLSNVNVHDNGNIGIECRIYSNLNIIDNVKSNNNSSNGICVFYNSAIYADNLECKTNGSWGCWIRSNSKINITGNCDISSNTSGDLLTNYNSFGLIEGSNTIGTIQPAVNTVPSYGDSTQGSYILQ